MFNINQIELIVTELICSLGLSFLALWLNKISICEVFLNESTKYLNDCINRSTHAYYPVDIVCFLIDIDWYGTIGQIKLLVCLAVVPRQRLSAVEDKQMISWIEPSIWLSGYVKLARWQLGDLALTHHIIWIDHLITICYRVRDYHLWLGAVFVIVKLPIYLS
jgi:hypothetical protein